MKIFKTLKKLLRVLCIISMMLSTTFFNARYETVPLRAEHATRSGHLSADDMQEQEALELVEHRLAEPTPIATVFPDPALAELIAHSLKKPSIMSTITQAELNRMTVLTSLEPKERAIEDLTGLEFITKLEELTLSGHDIRALGPLATLKKLMRLSLVGNEISDLNPLSELKKLSKLQLDDNQIRDLSPLAALTKLGELSLNHNQISDLQPLAALNKLTTLHIDDNQIDNLSPLASLTKLHTVSMSANSIQDVSPLAPLKRIADLTLDNNQISDISPLATIKQLGDLSMNHNQISDLSPLASSKLLRVLSLGENQISDLGPLAALVGLTNLRLNNNQISDTTPLSALRALVQLNLHTNQISDITPLRVLGQLKVMNVARNHIMDITPFKKAAFVTIQSIDMSEQSNNPVPLVPASDEITIENPVKNFDGERVIPRQIEPAGTYEPPFVTWRLKPSHTSSTVSYDWHEQIPFGNGAIEYSGTYTVEIEPSLSYRVTFIVDETEYGVDTVQRDTLINAPTVPTKVGYQFVGWYTEEKGGRQWDFAADAMPAADITLYAHFERNVYVVTYENGIDDGSSFNVEFGQPLIEPNEPVKQGYVFLGWYTEPIDGQQWNFATDTMPANNLTLYAQYTKRAGKMIQELFPDTVLAGEIARILEKTGIDDFVTEEELATITAISYSGWQQPKISNIEGLQYVKNLAAIALFDNSIVDISVLAHLAQLTKLDMYANQISDISAISGLTKLTSLDLSANKITDVRPLADLSQLTKLYLGSNDIVDISSLANVSQLREIDLDANHIRDVSALASLTQLTHLYMNGNKISDIGPLAVLGELTILHLADNQISELTPLSMCTKLTNLNADFNYIRTVEALAHLPQLVRLSLSHNGVTDMRGLMQLMQLKYLNLSGNSVNDLSVLAKATLPQLTQLYLDDNYIIDVTPLKEMNVSQIERIYIRNQTNRTITTLPYSKVVTVENKIKNINGNLVVPSEIAASGHYESPFLTWDLPQLAQHTTLTYTWEDQAEFAAGTVFYSGTYTTEVAPTLYYGLTFIVDGHVHESVEIARDHLIGEPVAPEKSGYTFVGWYTAADGGRRWDFTHDTMPADDLTLHARYMVNDEGEISALVPDAVLAHKLA
jgi:uncharacterized repeat protein (TIGR02543 family)